MSVYLAAITIAVLVAQGSKVVAVLLSDHKSDWPLALTRSGGMPSAHTALMVAVTTVIGVQLGVDSALFALSLALTIVIIYDALNVRRSVGEQGIALKGLVEHLKLAAEGYIHKQSKGHHPIEAMVGVMTGVIAAIIALALFAPA